MSRRRTKPEEIKNKNHYFKRYIAKESLHDHISQNDYESIRTDCIIVKDLSRFGRNYLDAGEYIEKIFPFLGVRFIAVNDNYDSLAGKNASDDLIIPFKNLINERLLRMNQTASCGYT